mmetsp:Transcript_2036/g.4612  ORF Transcript_2036/g.4612 Transcript_2036/m.4612 type:complete len:339 (-) Transcript_2036:123-1139(-)|eukprot:CAMPEP_0171509368 /NCGR_PEP_ID=MMETSP0958-20121227/14738_1 /TAXON_ID=87120 /ORGANISM="Aurantiochytrium limacinum, Strain ATCCMYA-1381" /LENGTH=338 /DNA_ID=CAMNT_0012046613 /DNA_START=169 /DNA_END=1185 /DNA_ORIENTATION=-
MGQGATTREEPSYFAASCAKKETFVNLQGLQIATYEWAHKTEGAPKGIVIGIHGVSCHLHYEYLNIGSFAGDEGSEGYAGAELHEPRYDGSWIEQLNKQGYIFTGMDLQSYGMSEGSRGLEHFFEQFEDLPRDHIQFRKNLTAKYPDIPIYVMGISLGGCIAARLAELDCDHPYGGTILLAPMLSLEQLKQKPINKILLPLAGVISWLTPTARLAEKSMHPEELMFKHFENDELNEKALKVRSRVAAECLVGVETTRRNLHKINCPLLAIHSRHDTMTDPAGSELAVDLASNQMKKLVLLDEPYLWHELDHEPGNEKVIRIVIDWLEEAAGANAVAKS